MILNIPSKQKFLKTLHRITLCPFLFYFFAFVLLGRHSGSMEGEQDVHGG
jgi:hypothetical protein